MNKIKKVILPIIGTTLGVAITIIGAWGILSSLQDIFQRMSSIEIGRNYNHRPIYSLEDAVVDSRGNIYYGLNLTLTSRAGSVQVYDNMGRFLYSVSFPTSTGMFFFYVDKDGIVNVFTARGGRKMSFYEGHLVYYRRIESSSQERQAVIDHIRAQQARRGFTDIYGNGYVLEPSNWAVRMYDLCGNFMRIVRQHISASPPFHLIPILVSVLGLTIFATAIKYLFVAILRHKRQSKHTD